MESKHDPIPFLMHYGTIRRSGRYPYGSGGQPYQEAKDFRGYLEDMRGQGMTDGEIAQRREVEIQGVAQDHHALVQGAARLAIESQRAVRPRNSLGLLGA